MSDVERWHEWTASISRVRWLDGGGMRVGARAKIKQPRFPSAVWRVTSVQPGVKFEWQNSSPGLHSVAGHVIGPDGAGCKVTLWVEQTGLLTPVVGLVLSDVTKKYLALEAEGLKKRCEAKS
jgi:hypothetical protein